MTTSNHSQVSCDIQPEPDCAFQSQDIHFMDLALEQAKQGLLSTTPNPAVGCIIASPQGEIVGEGFHKKAGLAHAEVKALKAASERSKGAIAYVTLEPCAHTGRTGPCAIALIEAGISKVFIACTDPNPLVAGKGIQILLDAGIQVRLGLRQTQALRLNEAFFFRLLHGRPFVSVKLACSIDGKTALADGQSKWITSEQARKDVQIERAKACAILSGSNTVVLDNPQLNVRPSELPDKLAKQFAYREQQPLRVIVDSNNRINSEHVVCNDGQPTVVYNRVFNVNIEQSSVIQVQQDLAQALCADNKIDLLEMLVQLGKQSINHVWVEAGAGLSGALFDAGLVDRLVLYQAPKILGKQARGLSDVNSPDLLANAATGKVVSLEQVGKDTKTVIDFR